jgi:integrase
MEAARKYRYIEHNPARDIITKFGKQGKTPATVSAQLGHLSIDTTMRVYTHAFKSAQAAAADALQTLLRNPKRETGAV